MRDNIKRGEEVIAVRTIGKLLRLLIDQVRASRDGQARCCARQELSGSNGTWRLQSRSVQLDLMPQVNMIFLGVLLYVFIGGKFCPVYKGMHTLDRRG